MDMALLIFFRSITRIEIIGEDEGVTELRLHSPVGQVILFADAEILQEMRDKVDKAPTYMPVPAR